MLEVRVCKTVTRVSAPFTEDDYCGKGERPNTEQAHNSPYVSRCSLQDLYTYVGKQTFVIHLIVLNNLTKFNYNR
jgi:hypothetical protein